MKRLTLALIGAAALPAVAMADITVKYDTIPTQPVEYKIHTISEMLKPRGEGAEPISGTATLTDGKYVIPTIAAGPAQYFIRTGDSQLLCPAGRLPLCPHHFAHSSGV